MTSGASDQSAAEPLSQRVRAELIRCCWEDPSLGARLRTEPDAVMRQVAARLPNAAAEREDVFAAVAERMVREGLPDCPHEFASDPRDFVSFWEHDFEPRLPASAPEPFQDVMEAITAPWLGAARSSAGQAWDALSAEAEGTLQEHARQLVRGVLMQPLLMHAALRAVDKVEESAGTEAGAVDQTIGAYPALGELLEHLTSCWIKNTANFARRLAADRAGLAETLGIEVHDRVTGVRAGFSDRHSGGQSVTRVDFESGATAFYKPRDLRIDRWWCDVLDWVRSSGHDPGLVVPRVLVRDGYGWMAAVRGEACSSGPEVTAWFRRAGQLAALGWVFGATDWHMGNILACRDQPVLVDCETVVSRADAGSSLTPLCFFPTSEPGPLALDLTGLGGRGLQLTDRRVPRWVFVEDSARLTYEPALIRTKPNVVSHKTPTGRDTAVDINGEHVSAIISGYRDTIGFLTEEAVEVLRRVQSVVGVPRRRVILATRQYYLAVNASLQLRNLSSPRARAAAIRGLLPSCGEASVDAVLRLDVPRSHVCDADAIESVRTRLAACDESLTEQQCSQVARYFAD